ncbi:MULTISPECIES: aspartate--ammonia ligase [unclassified Fusibacter]|uniref:aspartate--ammonia ligase n=1 Tax=unclassified Fusibacter TaxID=2624464 RepID=UPI001012F6F2|nr:MULTISPECIES: aspartate--ammonia ligase [unclassified Fusibacter]MCK8059786.1 aspartate--ammonia ligase [Fusibacter sp. A2]NPE21587.1 aspartate--ammonia ligase [Fusibacter sp. A1]RXV61994.1 aspartate--ammonia ligase [Fusibacter sp. A1]
MKTKTKIPTGYVSHLSLMETEIAIKTLKDYFERTLAKKLDLLRVSAPLFVKRESGLNDDLNGVERPVGFDHEDSRVEIVHSLAKWKRMALGRYGFEVGKGLYTDMNAIRRDEVLDELHSMYVDQWDWEKVITKDMRSEATLKEIVEAIYSVFKETAAHMSAIYPVLSFDLPEEIYFVSTQELEDMYPEMSTKEREDAITEKLKAVFISKIGHDLVSGKPHDGRAPDYDDWTLNGDIVFWNPVLKQAFELSSMGIRVDEDALEKQLELRGASDRLSMPFHKALMDGELPYTVGGGIGQSRICMFFLQKAHIGEVQASIWDQETHSVCQKHGVVLL